MTLLPKVQRPDVTPMMAQPSAEMPRKVRVKSTIDVQEARKTDSAILCSSVAGAI
jgi:hypothetical protein